MRLAIGLDVIVGLARLGFQIVDLLQEQGIRLTRGGFCLASVEPSIKALATAVESRAAFSAESDETINSMT